MSKRECKAFTAGQAVEFAIDPSVERDPWTAGIYVEPIADMRGHHWVAVPGETKVLRWPGGSKVVPARYIVPTRRLRAKA